MPPKQNAINTNFAEGLESLTDLDKNELIALQSLLTCQLSQAPLENPVATLCCGSLYSQSELQERNGSHAKECLHCDNPFRGVIKVSVMANTLGFLEITKSALSKRNVSHFDIKQILLDIKTESIDYIIAELSCSITQMICLDPVVSTQCGHLYEESEVKRWLAKKGSCPCCRVNMNTEHLLKLPVLSSLIDVLSKYFSSVAKNRYFNVDKIRECVNSGDAVQLKKIGRIIECNPSLLNEMGGCGMPAAFYLSLTIESRNILKKIPFVCDVLTKESINKIKSIGGGNAQGASLLYFMVIDFITTEDSPFFLDHAIWDKVEADTLGSLREDEIYNVTPLLHLVFSPKGRELIISSENLVRKINRFSLNVISKMGDYRSASVLTQFTYHPDLRFFLYKNSFLQKNMGVAINETFSSDHAISDPDLADTSPLLWLTTQIAGEKYLLSDILHSSDIRSEITEEALNRITSNKMLCGKSPALNLIVGDKSYKLLERYSDLRDKIHVKTINSTVITAYSTLKGLTPLYILVKRFHLLNDAINLQRKVTAEGLLFVCTEPGPHFGRSPLTDLLKKEMSGRDLLRRLIRENTLLRRDLFLILKIPNNIDINDDCVLMLYLISALKSRSLFEFTPINMTAQCQDMNMSYQHLLNSVMSMFIMPKMKTPGGVFSSPNLRSIVALIMKNTEAPYMIFDHESIFSLLMSRKEGRLCINESPQFWGNIPPEALNATYHIDTDDNTDINLGISALFIMALGKSLNEGLSPLDSDAFVQKIKPFALYVRSNLAKLEAGKSPLWLLLNSDGINSLLGSEVFRRKIRAEDLLHNFFLEGDVRSDYFSLLMKTKNGIKLLQLLINESDRFRNYILNCPNKKLIQDLRSSGVEFKKLDIIKREPVAIIPVAASAVPVGMLAPASVVVPKPKAKNISRVISPDQLSSGGYGYYTLRDLLSYCLVSKENNITIKPIMNDIHSNIKHKS